MAVKTLGTFLSRLKHSLNHELCVNCHTMIRIGPEQLLCMACERHLMMRQGVPVLSIAPGAIYAACEFPYKVKQLIYGLKFHRKTQNGLPLSELLIHYWSKLPHNPKVHWVVVPVPPHQEDSFRHVACIARPFASHFGLDFIEDGLMWTRAVQPQHTVLNKRKRRENVAGALQVTPTLLKRITQPNTRILIVDDLVTTGSTMVAALDAVQQAGLSASATALSVSHVPMAIRRRQFNGQ